MSAKIYIEGGGDSKELNTRCRQGFRKLLEKCGFTGKMPHLVACGSRNDTFGDFSTAHDAAGGRRYVAMLVDSEDPVADIEQTWAHLKTRDGWDAPTGATDDQVLLMTTCMETWIVTDRNALRDHYSGCLRENALPPLANMETRTRGSVQIAIVQASRDCKNKYEKGKRSFEILEKLDPEQLKDHLPSFVRLKRVLGEKL